MTPRISIAMCTYNGARWMRAQLDSIAAQTKLPDELIVCDDRSTDATVQILKNFAAAAPFAVRVIVNESNLGLTANFAKAFEQASGDLIFFSDQDDVWRSEKLAKFEATFASSPEVGLVFADACVVDPQLKTLGHTHWQSVDFSLARQEIVRRGQAFELLVQHSFVAGATMAVAGRLRSALLPIPQHWAFDGWIAATAAALSETRIIAEPLNDYRQHPQQLLGGTKKGFWRRYVEAKCAVDDQYYIRAAAMAGSLRDRLIEVGVTSSDRRIAHLEQKIRFARSRAQMRSSIWRRYPLLLRELAAGRYHKFGQGWRSAAIDALV